VARHGLVSQTLTSDLTLKFQIAGAEIPMAAVSKRWGEVSKRFGVKGHDINRRDRPQVLDRGGR
jgi:hypothetical protein